MLLNSYNIEITVFKIDNETFQMIGAVNQFTSLILPNKYNGYSTVEFNAPVTEENKRLVQKGHVVWWGDEQAAVIEIITSDTDEDGQKTYNVKGRTLEMLLTTRIVWNTYDCYKLNASTAIYQLVDMNCINPTDSKRKIPYLECEEDKKFGELLTFQKTGGEVYEAVESICNDNGLGFEVLFLPREKKMVFRVKQGVNKTVEQKGGKSVLLSTDLEDILDSSYYTNNQDYKTMALVEGEDSAELRKEAIAGDGNGVGLSRRELYVDARDLQSTYIDEETQEEVEMPIEQYMELLVSRGNEKISEVAPTETFEVSVRIDSNTQYAYGVDYFLGDTITVEDEDIGVRVNAVVDEVCQSFSEKYEFTLTLGFGYPSLFQRIKRKYML